MTPPRRRARLPGKFDELVHLMAPRAIKDEAAYESTMAMIDRLMANDKLTNGQSVYLETLVQLVQAYEAAHHAIDTSDLSGLDSLKHLMDENHMNASDLARLLGVHASMGSKILKRERSLTVDHLKKLSSRFKVSPEIFIEGLQDMKWVKPSGKGGRGPSPRGTPLPPRRDRQR